MSLHTLSLSDLQKQLASKKVSPREAVLALRKRIEAVDPTLHAYVAHDWDKALADADQADVSLPLGGVPIAIKDNISVRGQTCTCGSRILEGYVAPFDATVIEKLRAAGAIPVGRTNMDEFAMGSSTETSVHGVTRNPWDADRIPGGSSGGSAAAVGGDAAFAALGSDTGGSIRQPAALCGCVGLKPTYGRVSRYGLVAFASSLDQIGPITKTVEDTARLYEVLCGKDDRDSTSLDRPAEDVMSGLRGGWKGLRVGVPKEYFAGGLDPRIEASVRDALALMQKGGAELVDVSLPHTEYAVAAYYIIAPAEASANLARFDGVRYGARVTDGKDVLDVYGRTRARGFGNEVKRRILLGTYALSSGYYDAYYLRAQKVRTLLRQDFDTAFKTCDVIATPTSPIPAFRLGEKMDNPLQMYLADVFTIAVNMAGTCAISLPCGWIREGESPLPVGLQLIGRPLDEATLLRAAWAHEQTAPTRPTQPL